MGNSATACSCSKGARLVKNEVKRSTLVLVGKVISIEEMAFEIKDSVTIAKEGRSASFRKITFQVFRLFKGKKKGQKVVVYTGLGKGDCGYWFRIGQRYILYGNESASPFWRNRTVPPEGLAKVYWTDICTRTQGFNAKEISALRSAQKK
jgi:hypothetical protein